MSASPAALKTELTVHAEAGAELARQLDDDQRARLPVHEHVRIGRAADEIVVALATELAASLIVVGSHGHTGLERALLGSTAERTVRHAGCPVVVVKHSPTGTAADRHRPGPNSPGARRAALRRIR